MAEAASDDGGAAAGDGDLGARGDGAALRSVAGNV
jgi:hypothetical protein